MITFPLFEIAAVTAISAGIVSLGQIKKSGAIGKGSAIAGLVLGIVGEILMLLLASLAIQYLLAD